MHLHRGHTESMSIGPSCLRAGNGDGMLTFCCPPPPPQILTCMLEQKIEFSLFSHLIHFSSLAPMQLTASCTQSTWHGSRCLSGRLHACSRGEASKSRPGSRRCVYQLCREQYCVAEYLHLLHVLPEGGGGVHEEDGKPSPFLRQD